MKIYKVLGLMSGTSLDGLDLCYCHLWSVNDTWQYEIVKAKSVAYEKAMRNKLKDAIFLKAEALLIFHNAYGHWLGEQARQFIAENNLEVDFISSHGHTTHHKPEAGLTFQIGSGQHLANTSGYRTICDFRSNDLALGGQGAPLVPIGDKLLLDEYDYCLNLGGISNISFDYKAQRLAFDVGLANMILNHITAKIDMPYDDGGQLAKSGSLNQEMLSALNALEYYKLPYPKSTGYEWFIAEVVPIVERTTDTTANLLHTSIHHICEQLAIQLNSFSSGKTARLLVTGGGALNLFMIETLKAKLNASISVIVPSTTLIAYKEALVFALMGVLRLENKINVFSSVTGASRDCTGGVVYFPS